MNKLKKFVKFCIPVLIYIACSLLAFLLWKLFNFAAAPIISTSVILCIIGSLASGYFAKGRAGKAGIALTIAAIIISTVLLLIAFTSHNDVVAYIGAVLSSYLYNIETCLPFGTSIYIVYSGFAVFTIVPIALIVLGKYIKKKTAINKSKKKA